MKDKSGIIIGLVVTLAVIVTLAIWMINRGTLNILELGSFAIIIIVGVAVYILWDCTKNTRKGLPVKDERILSISYKAGYYGFIAAIWSAVLGPTIIDILFKYELEASRVSALVVLVSGFVFILSYFYQYRKGNEI